jgi:hypothetical protein
MFYELPSFGVMLCVVVISSVKASMIDECLQPSLVNMKGYQA